MPLWGVGGEKTMNRTQEHPMNYLDQKDLLNSMICWFKINQWMTSFDKMKRIVQLEGTHKTKKWNYYEDVCESKSVSTTFLKQRYSKTFAMWDYT